MKNWLKTTAALLAAASMMAPSVFAEEINVGTFTNIYTPDSVSAKINLTQTLTDKSNSGKTLSDETFQYSVQEYSDADFTTKSGDAKTISGNGSDVSFSESYDTAGPHYYMVTETAGTTAGMTYDNTSKKVTVNVTEDAVSDSLLANVVLPEDTSFDNVYQAASADVVFTGNVECKTAAGTERKLDDDEFSFVLKDAKGTEVARASSKADGTITFGDFSFGTCGTYTYSVAEVAGDDSHIKYDDSVKVVQFKVVDENGQLKVSEVEKQ